MWSNIKVNYTSCVLCSPLSDHFPTFANFELKPANHSRWIKFRDFSNKRVHMYVEHKAEIFTPFYEAKPSEVIDMMSRKFPNVIKKFFPIKKEKGYCKAYQSSLDYEQYHEMYQ